MKKYFLLLLLSITLLINVNASDSLFARIYLSNDFEIESTLLGNKEVSEKQFSENLIKSGLSNESELKSGLLDWVKQNIIVLQQDGIIRKMISGDEYVIVRFAKGLVIYRSTKTTIDQPLVKPLDEPGKKQSISVENIILFAGLGFIVILSVILLINQSSLRRLTANNKREIKAIILENSNRPHQDNKPAKEQSDIIIKQFMTSENAPYFPVILKNIQNLTEEIKNIRNSTLKTNDPKQDKPNNFTEIKFKEISSSIEKINVSIELLGKRLGENEKKIIERLDDKTGLENLKL